MTRKYKIFLGLIVLWAIAVPLFANLNGTWFSLGIPKLLDHIGVLQVSSTMCMESISGGCITNMAIRFAIWPYISILVALLGLSYVIDLILRSSLTVGKTILGLLFVTIFIVLAIFLGGGQLYMSFLTNVLNFTGYSRDLLLHYNIYVASLLLGLVAIAPDLFTRPLAGRIPRPSGRG